MHEVFVFGSNLLGIHKRGAALCALNEHGAKLGRGIGLQGNSYALPTKSTPYQSLSLLEINKFVADFLLYAHFTPNNMYRVTPIGCGLAGYTPSQIAPMFRLALMMSNIQLPDEFIHFMNI